MKNVFETIEMAKKLAANKNVTLEICSSAFIDDEHLDVNDYCNNTDLMVMGYKGFCVFVYVGDWDSFEECGKWIDYDIFDSNEQLMNDGDNICLTNDVLEAATDIEFYMDKIDKIIESINI